MKINLVQRGILWSLQSGDEAWGRQTRNHHSDISMGVLISWTQSVSSTRCFCGYTCTFLTGCLSAGHWTLQSLHGLGCYMALLLYSALLNVKAPLQPQRHLRTLGNIYTRFWHTSTYFPSIKWSVCVEAEHLLKADTQIKLSIWLLNKSHMLSKSIHRHKETLS